MPAKYQPYIMFIIEALVLVNGFLTARGCNPIQVSDAEIYAGVSYAAAIAAFLWAMWKNHNFTEAAKQAQDVLGMLKSGSDLELRYTHGGEHESDRDQYTHEFFDPED